MRENQERERAINGFSIFCSDGLGSEEIIFFLVVMVFAKSVCCLLNII